MTQFTEDSVNEREPDWRINGPTLWKGIAWSTLLLLMIIVSAIVYFMVYGGYLGLTQTDLFIDANSDVVEAMIVDHGEDVVGSTPGVLFIEFILMVPLVLLISNFKGYSWKETLAVRGFSQYWLKIGLILFAIFSVISFFIEQYLIVEVDAMIVALAGSKSLLIAFSFVVLAPIIEELVFRGYMFAVLRKTRLGMIGTVVVTSFIFTLAHATQYQVLVLLPLFMFACVLAYLRDKSGSILLPMLLHMLNNLLFSIFVVYLGMV